MEKKEKGSCYPFDGTAHSFAYGGVIYPNEPAKGQEELENAKDKEDEE